MIVVVFVVGSSSSPFLLSLFPCLSFSLRPQQLHYILIKRIHLSFQSLASPSHIPIPGISHLHLSQSNQINAIQPLLSPQELFLHFIVLVSTLYPTPPSYPSPPLYIKPTPTTSSPYLTRRTCHIRAMFCSIVISASSLMVLSDPSRVSPSPHPRIHIPTLIPKITFILSPHIQLIFFSIFAGDQNDSMLFSWFIVSIGILWIVVSPSLIICNAKRVNASVSLGRYRDSIVFNLMVL